MSESLSRMVILGNPENRRVVHFQELADRLQVERPKCVSWTTLLAEPDRALAELSYGFPVRIESPGENNLVTQKLIELGGGAEDALRHAEIAYLDEQYHGFRMLLEQLSAAKLWCMNAPFDIATMFDKWKSHLRFESASLSRPETWQAPGSWDELMDTRQQLASYQSGRVFLKPRYASSASGVCALRWSGDKIQLIAPIELRRIASKGRVATRLYNSLRVRSYIKLTDVRAILDRLLRQSVIVERWIPKARLPDGAFDLRILVIAGEARHMVVRQSHSPMTNLHLGNRRGCLDEVVEKLGSACVERCRELAVAAAGCFSGSLYAGIDVIVSSQGNPYVCEINAFGDLLPRVFDRGETTEEAIWRASHASCNRV